MRKSLSIALIALVLATWAAAPVQTRAAPTRANRVATPLSYNCADGHEHWIELYGNDGSHWYINRAYTEAANMAVYVNGNNQYCGYIQSGATDQLVSGCATFKGAIYSVVAGGHLSGTVWSYYQCTAKTYVFWGPIISYGCPVGNELIGDNWVYETGDYAPSPPPAFYC